MKRLHIAVAGALTLVFAGGSGAYAGSQITGGQIKNGTVTGQDIKDRSIGAVDLAASASSALRGPAGPQGPAGPSGPAGASGPAGPAGPSAVARLTRLGKGATIGVTDDTFVVGVTATCPAGQSVVSGGYYEDVAGQGEVFANGPSQDAGSWIVAAANYGDTPGTVSAYALCSPTGVAVASSVSERHARAQREVAAIIRRAHKHRAPAGR